MTESYSNTPSSKIRWLCLSQELDAQSESNFDFAAYELSKAVKKLQMVKQEQDTVDEFGSEEKRLRAFKATLLLKAIHNLEEQIKENKQEVDFYQDNAGGNTISNEVHQEQLQPLEARVESTFERDGNEQAEFSDDNLSEKENRFSTFMIEGDVSSNYKEKTIKFNDNNNEELFNYDGEYSYTSQNILDSETNEIFSNKYDE